MMRRLIKAALAAVLTCAPGLVTQAAIATETPQQELTVLLEAFATELGQGGLRAGGTIDALPAELATSLTQTFNDLFDCHRKSNKAKKDTSDADLIAGKIAASHAAAIRLCGQQLDSSAAGLGLVLNSLAIGGKTAIPRVDLWPVLRIEPGATATTYNHDYSLLLDLGGNDVYDNNAGGNLLDVQRGPGAGISPGEAKGCQNVQALVLGQCVISSSVLIDTAGNDSYGVLEPAEEDSSFTNMFDGTTVRCTSDQLVRRIVTGGAGFMGAGILMDMEGNDRYFGKTVTLGAGHVAGYGKLQDYEGNDRYSAIRYAMGNGLVGGGYGVLTDEAGNDSYGYYMPAADATHTGGIVTDKGACDATSKEILGTGKLGATGIFEDRAGDDVYAGPPSSMGFGSEAGTGFFWDRGGRDRYTGPAGRADGVTIHPGIASTGLFIDES